jgi:hypothetical protein
VRSQVQVHEDYIASVAECPTLYEWAGGRDPFDRMINAFYDRVEQDDLLSPFFHTPASNNCQHLGINAYPVVNGVGRHRATK